MRRFFQSVALIVVPVLIALIAVTREYTITDWAGRREAVLPASIFVLLAALLNPRLRHGLVITLCYGVSFMALRDIGRVGRQPLPPSLSYDFIDHTRPAVLLLVAGLAATAALAETFRSGTVWARRCYFGAASLYFTGLGIIHFGKYGSWQAIMLCVTGVTAMFGCVFANRIVEAEIDDDEMDISDEAIQQLTEAAHRRALRDKEWHDRSEPLASSGPSITTL